MLPDGRLLGVHLPLGAGMVKAADRAREIGATVIQIFSDNPTAWHRRADAPRELPAFRARLADHGIGTLAIHAAYLINLAGSDQEFYERSIDVLAHELSTAPAFGARFVNVHIGSHRGAGAEAGTSRVADAVARILCGPARDVVDGPMLLLENSAGGGFGLGASIDEIGGIIDAIDARGVPRTRLGICLDTAHLWGAGYRISAPAEIDSLLAQFDRLIGLDRLAMVHVNDSRAPMGSNIDRHQHVGAGEIGPLGMGHLLRHPRLAHIAFVIETPGMDEGYDAINLKRAIDLAAGRPLDSLPPEALEMKGTRARSAPRGD
ncbi:MAG TPA: deoxyribonuclease IV [Candidatus Limnocylindrales bacterium]